MNSKVTPSRLWLDFSKHQDVTNSKISAKLVLTNQAPTIHLDGDIGSHEASVLVSLGFQRDTSGHSRVVSGLDLGHLRLAFPLVNITEQSVDSFLVDRREAAKPAPPTSSATERTKSVDEFMHGALNYLYEQATEANIDGHRVFHGIVPPAYRMLPSWLEENAPPFGGASASNPERLYFHDNQWVKVVVGANNIVTMDFFTNAFMESRQEALNNEIEGFTDKEFDVPFEYESLVVVRLQNGKFAACQKGSTPEQIINNLSSIADSPAGVLRATIRHPDLSPLLLTPAEWADAIALHEKIQIESETDAEAVVEKAPVPSSSKPVKEDDVSKAAPSTDDITESKADTQDIAPASPTENDLVPITEIVGDIYSWRAAVGQALDIIRDLADDPRVSLMKVQPHTSDASLADYLAANYQLTIEEAQRYIEPSKSVPPPASPEKTYERFVGQPWADEAMRLQAELIEQEIEADSDISNGADEPLPAEPATTDTAISTAPEHRSNQRKPLDETRTFDYTAANVNDAKGFDPVDESLVPITMDVDAFREITDEWASLFQDPPERVSLEKSAKAEGFLSESEAQARVDSWKENVRKQFRENRSENSNRTILSFFDLSGEWSRPYEEAGYNVIRFDIQSGQDVMEFSADYFIENWDFGEVWGILAACPCTDFASSGARWFAEKDADGRTEASKELVFQTLRTIEYFRPKGFWALENPVGRIERLTGLPKARLIFQPHHFGEDYTKKTILWGQFNEDLPIANTEPTAGSKMHSQYGGKSLATKNARSATPEGFAYSFFQANNYVDMSPERRLLSNYPEASGAIKVALSEGISEARIAELMYETYEYYEYEAARNALIQEIAAITNNSDASEDIETAEFEEIVEEPKTEKLDLASSPLPAEPKATTMDTAVDERKSAEAPNVIEVANTTASEPEHSSAPSKSNNVLSFTDSKRLRTAQDTFEADQTSKSIEETLKDIGTDYPSLIGLITEYVELSQDKEVPSLQDARRIAQLDTEISELISQARQAGYEVDLANLISFTQSSLDADNHTKQVIEETGYNFLKIETSTLKGLHEHRIAELVATILHQNGTSSNLPLHSQLQAYTTIARYWGSAKDASFAETFMGEQISSIQGLKDYLANEMDQSYKKVLLRYQIAQLQVFIDGYNQLSPIPRTNAQNEQRELRKELANVSYAPDLIEITDEHIESYRLTGSYSEFVEILEDQHKLSFEAAQILAERIQNEFYNRNNNAYRARPAYQALRSLDSKLQDWKLTDDPQQPRQSQLVCSSGPMELTISVVENENSEQSGFTWHFSADYYKPYSKELSAEAKHFNVDGDRSESIDDIIDMANEFRKLYKTQVDCSNLPSYGEEYAKESIYDLTAINKHLRERVKQDKAAGILPKDVKATFKKHGYGSLKITIKDAPRSLYPLINPDWNSFKAANPHTSYSEYPSKYTAEGAALIRYFEAIANAYNYHDSDPYADYRNFNFVLDVNLSEELLENDKAASAAKEISANTLSKAKFSYIAPDHQQDSPIMGQLAKLMDDTALSKLLASEGPYFEELLIHYPGVMELAVRALPSNISNRLELVFNHRLDPSYSSEQLDSELTVTLDARGQLELYSVVLTNPDNGDVVHGIGEEALEITDGLISHYTKFAHSYNILTDHAQETLSDEQLGTDSPAPAGELDKPASGNRGADETGIAAGKLVDPNRATDREPGARNDGAIDPIRTADPGSRATGTGTPQRAPEKAGSGKRLDSRGDRNPVELDHDNQLVIERDESLFFSPEKQLNAIYKAERADYELIANTAACIELYCDIVKAGGHKTLSQDQMTMLAEYTGAGHKAIRKELERYQAYSQDLRRALARLKEVDSSAYRALKASTLTAYFTPKPVVDFMWSALDRLGISNATHSLSITEPACGTGHFIGLAPNSVRRSAEITAVDLDAMSATITGHLYPEAKVINKGFEKILMPEGSQDIVTGNVPFGDFVIYDRKTGKSPLVHDYFLLQSVRLAKPGGLVSFVTSTGTLDKANPAIRKALYRDADLVHAIRLPSDTFQSSGTEVVSDMVFFRKRKPGEARGDDRWVNSVEAPKALQPSQEDPESKPAFINQYFLDHPGHVHGTLTGKIGQYGAEIGVEWTDSAVNSLDALSERLADIKENVFDAEPVQHRKAPKVFESSEHQSAAIKRGSYALVDGAISIYLGDSVYQEVKLNKRERSGIADYIPLRDAATTLYEAERSYQPDDVTEPLRESLNRIYDNFVTSHGPLSECKFLKKLKRDPDCFSVLALELYDLASRTYIKSSIFEERAVALSSKPEITDIRDAIAVAMDESAMINADRVANLLQIELDDAIEQLKATCFLDPDIGAWIPAPLYLAGDMYRKLEDAEAAAEVNPAFKANVEALKENLPKPVPIEDISVKLGSFWIPDHMISQFIRETLDLNKAGYSDRVDVKYNSTTAEWKVKVTGAALAACDKLNTTVHGIPECSFVELVKCALELKQPTVKKRFNDELIVDHENTSLARAKLKEIQANFESFIKYSTSYPERADEVEALYNQTFNRFKEAGYDGSYLSFPGQAKTLKGSPLQFRSHQYQGVERALTTPHGDLLAHEAGAGKTIEQITIAYEHKRLGFAKKPVLVVPNHMLEQFTFEAYELYPSAKIYTANKELLASADGRSQTAARIAAEDWDLVIITHGMWDAIALPEEYIRSSMESELDGYESLLREAQFEGDKWSERRIQRSIKNLEAKIDRMVDRVTRKKDAIQFDQLGIDFVSYDEAHYLKNIAFPTKLGQIAGVNTTTSIRGLDSMMKFDYIREQRGDEKGVLLATATPITNSLSELYVMARLAAPQLLRDMDLQHFDHFLSNFAEVVEHVEIKPEGGGYQVKQRLSKFNNVPELIRLFRTFADIKTAEDLDLPTPNCEEIRHVAAASDQIKLFMNWLGHRAQSVRNGSVDASEDNLLRISTHGRLAAIDMRLLNPKLPDDPQSKLNLCVKEVFEKWAEHKTDARTQLVFCDSGTPGPNKTFDLYNDMKAKWIAMGIPAEEIAFIHDAKTDADKERLFSKVRSGEIRILLGSSDKMGVGTNVQTRGSDLHMLDVPWRPIDVHQRRKRFDRQGNLFDGVNIHFYSTEDSFDLFMFEALIRKLKFITQGMASPEKCARSMEEDCDPGFAEIMAITTGNTLIRDKIEVDSRLDELYMLSLGHDRSKRLAIRDIYQTETSLIPDVERRLAELTSLRDTIEQNRNPDFAGGLDIVVEGQRFDKHGLAGAAIIAALKRNPVFGKGFQCGHIMGIPFSCFNKGNSYAVKLDTALPIEVDITKRPEQFVSMLERALQNIPTRIAYTESQIENYRSQLVELTSQAESEFPHAAELQDLDKRSRELDVELREMAEQEDPSQFITTEGLHEFELLLESVGGLVGTKKQAAKPSLTDDELITVADIVAAQSVPSQAPTPLH
ncbi:DEAD/DEAH box helicase family protein [Marinobacterium jannaschii]|uniref:DEAD/DEAH box helicase family protein n=1 Tax=Marinobacterium jannaschii TaxID=64970 RepID=UPI00055AD4FF|nr:DEAD/DEAH box helicase family protein [Marinobacterium jannaschii]